MPLCISLIFLCCNCFGQNKLYPLPFSYPKELKFYSVENSKIEITEEELKTFAVIDTLSNPYSLLISDFSSISIAIKSTDKYKVYRLLTRPEINKRTIQELGDPRNRCDSSLQITEIKNIRLDEAGNDELILTFLNSSYCCPTCAIPLNWQIYEGYVIFDIDKLKVLDITTKSNTVILSNGVPAKDVKIEFEKNYLRFGKRKYYYKNDSLVRK